MNKWLVFHTYDSRFSSEKKGICPGFPDLVLVKPPRILFIELKTEKGIVSDGQKEWLEALKKVERIGAGTIRPHEIDTLFSDLLN